MTLWMAAQFAGGIGLFLLGMTLMTEGLKVAAGKALRRILTRWTSSQGRGVASGLLITAVVQSSSAVTFAVIGFVNAGLLTLSQAVGVIYGSNVGTTVTGWIVAMIGFKVNMEVVALPAIAAGMLLRVLSTAARLRALGEAMAGFGVFFMGIGVLKASFDGIGQGVSFDFVAEWGVWGQLAMVGCGFVLTVLMQSSSAALALVLTAVGTGMLSLSSAAAAVIGANLGTTSTAAFAVIGATPNAKRAAMAHVIFNLVMGAAAFAMLPLWLVGIDWLAAAAGLESQQATLLAAFHTAINIVGLAVLWPLSGWLVGFLEQRFRAAEEIEAKPQHLDRNVVGTPALALDAVVLELERVGRIARRAARAALRPDDSSSLRVEYDHRTVEQLILAIGDFVGRVYQATLSKELSDAFPRALRVTQYLMEIVNGARQVLFIGREQPEVADAELAGQWEAYRVDVLRAIEAADPARAVEPLEAQYQLLKEHVLRAVAQGRVGFGDAMPLREQASEVHRMLDQSHKAATCLRGILETLNPSDSQHVSPPDGSTPPAKA